MKKPFLVGLLLVMVFVLPAFSQQTWWRTYGGRYDDRGYSVQQTTDGGYIIAGSTMSFGSGNNEDVYLIKTNASGDTLWTRTYGGTNGGAGNSVQQTSDGGYIITGLGPGTSHNANVYLIKTNVQGDTLWSRTYGGAKEGWGFSVQQTSDGGYITAGFMCPLGDTLGDVYLIKTNASGNIGPYNYIFNQGA